MEGGKEEKSRSDVAPVYNSSKSGPAGEDGRVEEEEDGEEEGKEEEEEESAVVGKGRGKIATSSGLYRRLQL